MKTWEKIVVYGFMIFWVTAPFLVAYVLQKRNILLPSDLATWGVIIWYSIGIILLVWPDRNKPNYPNRGNGPSYTDKGQNDWMNRD